jgi:glycosyltransferase involved in cell wall biosynthesis
MTEPRPLVSIITPTRDQGRFIEQTLRSVAGQTYPRIEHIVVDGGSSDDTLAILGGFEASHDLRWWSEPDDGMYQAVNRGFARAKGDIFAYLNSDDLYFPWSVELAVRSLQAGADLVYGDALLLDDATGHLRPHFQLPYRREFLLSIGSFAQPATWWRRTLHDRIGGFDETLRSVADLDFYIRATAAGNVTQVREFLALMRQHAAMQTIASAPRLQKENAAVRDRYVRRRRHGVASRTVERAIAWERRRAAWARFVRSASQHDPERPWGRFIDQGVHLDPARILAGQLPIVGARFLSGAVSSDRDWRRFD